MHIIIGMSRWSVGPISAHEMFLSHINYVSLKSSLAWTTIISMCMILGMKFRLQVISHAYINTQQLV
ncbi:hypothetical protein Y032_0063g3419 [Ancylostoma ceylanicum]|uniref:Uncharacterized protein n=1 Tax=Ancylostoma ceylanicum TaxID=53326 RepID=A0A016U1M4_9BILA|nr:hypothetical protein Y032_0063g3419 [Ancylostoma ceylanicum]